MKKILTAVCILTAVYAVYFPLTYFGSPDDRMDVQVKHIFAETEEAAQNIKNDLNSGKNFDNEAELLGYMQRGRLDKNIEAAVFKAPKGEISEPVESAYGWHLLKVTDIKYFSDSRNFKYNKYKYLDL